MGISTIKEAIVDIKSGKMIILVDDEDRENEGDLFMAAEFVTPEAINFMARYGRGLICLTLTEEHADKLRLAPMVRDNRSRFGTAFTISIEAKQGVTTGISAADRATTIRAAVADDAKPEDLVSPGHVFPIRAKKGGVLVRTGQTEGSVDLARLAGMKPAGVICEVMKDDGTMARLAGTSGPWGNFLDATLDRVADGAIFGSLVVWAALNGQPWLVAGGVAALVTGQVTSGRMSRTAGLSMHRMAVP